MNSVRFGLCLLDSDLRRLFTGTPLKEYQEGKKIGHLQHAQDSILDLCVLVPLCK